MEPVLVEGFEIEIDESEVRRLLRMADATRRNEKVEKAIEEMLEIAKELIEPKGVYTVIDGSDFPVSGRFDGMGEMAFCICTIGPTLEEKVTRLSGERSMLEAVVLDSVGSVAAEATAEYIDRVIQEYAHSRGLKTSCRASPGYGDWDVSEQRAIFELLPAEKIGVRLTESFMMIPRKSVSFAINIAERPVRMRSENSCRNCPVKDCPYRLI